MNCGKHKNNLFDQYQFYQLTNHSQGRSIWGFIQGEMSYILQKEHTVPESGTAKIWNIRKTKYWLFLLVWHRAHGQHAKSSQQ